MRVFAAAADVDAGIVSAGAADTVDTTEGTSVSLLLMVARSWSPVAVVGASALSSWFSSSTATLSVN